MAASAHAMNTEEADGLTVLVVDDEAVNRLVIRTMLVDYGFEVVEARNGREACEVCMRLRPDLVLMDIMMPEMNGLDATARIKRHFGDAHVPVIFVTAVSDDVELSRCIEVGGDDFLVKPISRTLLTAKIDASLRLRAMHRRVEAQRDELLHHQARINSDLEIAKRILQSVDSQHSLEASNVSYLLRPMEMMNGDIILGGRRPSGEQVFLVGDFTGHGLPAAIGAQTVNGVFNAMIAKGLPLADIVRELNRKLRAILPVERFFSAAMLELDNQTGVARIWNGGMPDVLVRGSDGVLNAHYPSADLPLGILPEYLPTVVLTRIARDDLVIMISDGVIEAHNANEELFGNERFRRAVSFGSTPHEVLESVESAVALHVGATEQSDDLSMLLVACEPGNKDKLDATEEEFTVREYARNWDFNIVIGPREMRDGDPVSRLVQVIDAAQGLGVLRTRLFLILTELYSNALEHGLLRLDSRMKRDPEGFADYYQLRALRLEQMAQGSIRLHCSHAAISTGGSLTITVHHDGEGFDSSRRLRELQDNEDASGRGIALVRSLCGELRYADEGRQATAVFEWRAADS